MDPAIGRRAGGPQVEEVALDIRCDGLLRNPARHRLAQHPVVAAADLVKVVPDLRVPAFDEIAGLIPYLADG